jgi:hypothetical protein
LPRKAIGSSSGTRLRVDGGLQRRLNVGVECRMHLGSRRHRRPIIAACMADRLGEVVELPKYAVGLLFQ